ncbi:hypothetical protein ACWEQC_04160 [Streptomyces shenzhenensis]
MVLCHGHSVQDDLGVVEQSPASLREGDSAGGPNQQLHTELLLKVSDRA